MATFLKEPEYTEVRENKNKFTITKTVYIPYDYGRPSPEELKERFSDISPEFFRPYRTETVTNYSVYSTIGMRYLQVDSPSSTRQVEENIRRFRCRVATFEELLMFHLSPFMPETGALIALGSRIVPDHDRQLVPAIIRYTKHKSTFLRAVSKNCTWTEGIDQGLRRGFWKFLCVELK